jgi:hypothetical protein
MTPCVPNAIPPLRQITQPPEANLDYTLDWTPWIGTDTIATSVWEIPPGMTSSGNYVDTSARFATAWIAGGVEGKTYIVTNVITTVGPPVRTWAASLKFTIQHS